MPSVGIQPAGRVGYPLVSWPNRTASSIAPTLTTASTISELLPAAASTAGIVNTPVPMLPITSAVAENGPSPAACSLPPGGAGCAWPPGDCGPRVCLRCWT